jgi:hypothetical protein
MRSSMHRSGVVKQEDGNRVQATVGAGVEERRIAYVISTLGFRVA